MRSLLLGFIIIVSGSSAFACEQVQRLDKALAQFSYAFQTKNEACLIEQRNQILQLAFKEENHLYEGFILSLQPYLNADLNDHDDFALATSPFLDLIKSLQDQWFDRYLRKAVADQSLDLVLYAGAGTTASALTVMFAFKKVTPKYIEKGVFRAWTVVIQNLLANRDNLIALGLTSSKKQEFQYKAPFELLKVKDTFRWTHSDYKLIRDMITLSVGASAGVITGEIVNYHTQKSETYKKLQSKYPQSLKKGAKTFSRLAGTTPLSFAISFIISDGLIRGLESTLNWSAEKYKRHQLKKMEYDLLHEKHSELRRMTLAEEHVTAVLFLAAVKSRVALQELLEAENDYHEAIACYSNPGLLNLNTPNYRQIRIESHTTSLRQKTDKILRYWNPHIESNLNLIKYEMDLIKRLDLRHSQYLLSRLELALKLYDEAGSLTHQMKNMMERAEKVLGSEAFSHNPSPEYLLRLQEKINCPKAQSMDPMLMM